MNRRTKINPAPEIKWLNQFITEVKEKNRYFLSEESIKFLDRIISFNELDRNINIGFCFYRARIGHQEITMDDNYSEEELSELRYQGVEFPDDIITLDNSDMENPPAELASNGRMNPQNISYVYLADDVYGACAESKPYLKQTISVALVKNIKVLKIKDFTIFNQIENPFDLLLAKSIDYFLSEPISPEDTATDYIPTQIIAEFIKSKEYDGICYRSSLSSRSKNYVIFDKTKLSWEKGIKVMHLKEIKYTFKEIQTIESL